MKEKRNNIRYNIKLNIIVRGINDIFSAKITNLSLLGIFIETHRKFPVNSFLDMEIKIVPFDKKIEVLGKIIHVNENGVGVEFIDYFGESKQIIKKFVEYMEYYENRN